ncbi:MAG: bifunctional diaminohydroxyphosphoribosylaminopyrimidine deaminase/5-amino-6-(5-phosphoribosylamino)uracil reductase RibD, partial [Flavisolibacter sp.]
HFGKTPPCSELIIRNHIPTVVIGCRDPFEPNYSGGPSEKGIEKLIANGVEVISGILEKECLQINNRFFTFHTEHRPYIVLKWAQTLDGYIARTLDETFDGNTGKEKDMLQQRLLISNSMTNRMVHKWRSEEMSILVGTNTAVMDDPELSNRLWPGKSPIRLVIDRELVLPSSMNLLNGRQTTIVFNLKKHTLDEKASVSSLVPGNIYYYQVSEDTNLVHQVMHALYQMQIQSVLIEGGAKLLQSFIDDGSWDEARVITNNELTVTNGLPAPKLSDHLLISTTGILTDTIHTYRRIIRS